VPRSRSQRLCGRRKTARRPPGKPQQRALVGKPRMPPKAPGVHGKHWRWSRGDPPTSANLGEREDLRVHAARIALLRTVRGRARLIRVVPEDGAVSAKKEIGRMNKRQETEAPVFSMRAKSVAADRHEQALVTELARALTGLMTAGRGGLSGIVDTLARMVAIVAERGGDLAERLQIAAIADEIYSTLGIASTAALVELDERVDDVELKMDDVARQRTREELMLLHQRLGELEAVIRTRDEDYDPAVDLGGLMGRLSELEGRIDKIPWPDPSR